MLAQLKLSFGCDRVPKCSLGTRKKYSLLVQPPIIWLIGYCHGFGLFFDKPSVIFIIQETGDEAQACTLIRPEVRGVPFEDAG